MNNSLIYRLPENMEQLAGVIEAIPSDWDYLTAELVAPPILIERGRISINTGFNLTRRLPPISASPQWARDETKPCMGLADAVIDIIYGRKMPHTLTLEVGRERMNMDEFLKIVKFNLVLGYTGAIETRKYSGRFIGRDIPLAQIGVEFDTTDGILLGVDEELPPHVRMVWFEEYGGRMEHVDSFLNALERLGLERLELETA